MFDEALSALKTEMIQALCTNLRIPSVAMEPQADQPNGPEVARALEHALRVAQQLGFETKNLEGHVGWAEYGQGEEMVAVLGHLDVVPAGEGWHHPPFAGMIEEGHIYGRGTVDDKGPMFAALFALKAIKDSGLPLKRRIRLIFGTSEETGCEDMAYYNAHGEMPVSGFTPDAEFPVIHAEKGILNVWIRKTFQTEESALTLDRLQAGHALNMVPDLGRAWLKLGQDSVLIETRGVSAHASRPQDGTNAIAPLLGFLAHQDLPFEMQDAFAFLSHAFGQENLGKNIGIHLKDEVSGELTVNLGLLEGSQELLRGGLNIRYPVTFSRDQILEPLAQGLSRGGFEIESFSHMAPLHVDQKDPLVQILTDTYKEVTGQDLPPLSTGGGTYARSLPNILAFGPQFPGQENLCHQANEHIAIEDLLKISQIYAKAMYRLAT